MYLKMLNCLKRLLELEEEFMNEEMADELRNLLNHYQIIADFVNEKVRNKMSEEEDKLFVQWLDDYEILIFRTAKEFIEKFELEG